MASDPYAQQYWDEMVTSGEIDQNKDIRKIEENEHTSTITFTADELIVLHEALERRFVQVKKGRVKVLSAVARIRRAMRKAMM